MDGYKGIYGDGSYLHHGRNLTDKQWDIASGRYMQRIREQAEKERQIAELTERMRPLFAERNRLRRMNAVASLELVILSDSIPAHQIRRLLELTYRVERRIAELNAELGLES